MSFSFSSWWVNSCTAFILTLGNPWDHEIPLIPSLILMKAFLISVLLFSGLIYAIMEKIRMGSQTFKHRCILPYEVDVFGRSWHAEELERACCIYYKCSETQLQQCVMLCDISCAACAWIGTIHTQSGGSACVSLLDEMVQQPSVSAFSQQGWNIYKLIREVWV